MKLNEKVSYSAVAAAVAVACAGGAGLSPSTAEAATTSISTLVMSAQSNALATTSAFTTVTLAVALGAGYVSGDRIKIAIDGGSFPSTGKPDSVTCGGGTISSTIYDATSAQYRSSSTIAEGTTCNFVVAIQTRGIGTGAGLTYSATYAGTSETFDTGTRRVAARAVDQFSSGIGTRLAGEVDVNSGRYLFTTASVKGSLTGSGNEDHLVMTLTNNTATLSAGAAAAGVTAVVATVTGDFSFLDDDGTAGCTSTDISAGRGVAVASSGSLSIAENCRTLTLSVPGGAAGEFTTGLVTLALGKNTTATAGNYRASTTTAGTVIEKVLFAPQSFAVGVAFTYYNTTTGATSTGSLGTTTSASGNAGAWTLNGATITVPFMSYTATGTSSLSRILYLTNRSAQSGAVSVSAINESGTACADFDVGTVQGNSVLNMGAAVDAGIRACYGASFDGKVALTITANIPGSSATVYSAYNRNGSIATVVNSSNQ